MKKRGVWIAHEMIVFEKGELRRMCREVG